jgi:hypothetical protein
MSLIGFLLLCIVVGLLCYLAITFVPMPGQFKTAIPVIALVILLLVLILYMFGGTGYDVPIPRFR